ncbi:MAG: TRAP transporter large permease [Deltaproteobacteria bacterium]|nr:TRAP transporter large permease [Deltaproteobacteria bacterium]MBW1961193.1 TRAP transporter large permease [Deltaproteobacteria bacterium]MBW2152478.1 TRAP transporter large permease [Deltaproteobacteria bacterium]
MTAFLFISMMVLFAINVPIAFAVGLVSLASIYFFTDVPTAIIIQTMMKGTDSFPMMAIPFFVLAGQIMEEGDISRRIVDFASALVGFIRGALAMITVMAAMFFAGISGSAAADAAAVGSVMIPAMVKKRYSRSFSVAIQSAAGSIGVIIPPSVPMVIYGITANVSIARLFLGGYIPGLLMGVGLMAVSYIFARIYNYPREESFSIRQVWRAFRSSFLALLTAIIIIGGILSGVFTATEAAAVAVAYSLVLVLFIYRSISLLQLPRILIRACYTSSLVMITIATASTLSWVLASEQIPQQMAGFIVQTLRHPLLIILALNVMLLIVGSFLDCSPAIIIFVPILTPIAAKLGMDPIHFGCMVVINLAIGLSTPPVGVCTFVACSVGGMTISAITRPLMILLAVMIAVLLCIAYIPPLTLFVPNFFMG